MDESKILSMTIVVPEDKVGKDIRIMTQNDLTRASRVHVMRLDGGRDVKAKKSIKFKKPGEHLLEFEISTGVIVPDLFFTEERDDIHVTQLTIPDTCYAIMINGIMHFHFDCEVVIPDSVRVFGGCISHCDKGLKYDYRNFVNFHLGYIPETDETREEIILKEGVVKVSEHLGFHTKHLHIPASVTNLDDVKWYDHFMDEIDTLTIAEDNPRYKIIDGKVMDIKNNKQLYPIVRN